MGFFDQFTGASQKASLANANAQANSDLKRGFDEANTHFGQAYDLYQPYTDMRSQGQGDQNIYRQAIGLGTPDERTAAQDRYFSDPVFQKINSDQQNMMLKGLNARGLGGSGVAAAAGAKTAYGNYGGWLDRVNQSGNQGLEYGFKGTQGKAGIRGQQADLTYGYNSAKAGNAINYGNAQAAATTAGANNMMKTASGLFGTVMQGFTPGAGWTTPFGNMKSMFG